ncbi:PH domain-containing protein [Aliidiomarina sp. Khilg15.8]
MANARVNMDKIHGSKVDNWLLLLVVAVAIFVLLLATMLSLRGAGWLGLVLLMLGAVAPMWIVMATRYHITEEELRVRAGPFSWRIPLAQIKEVSACHSSRPAPALSRERLQITYGKGKQLMISPQDRYGFIFDLGVIDTPGDQDME